MALALDVVEFGLDLGLWQRTVGGEVDQVLFSPVEGSELSGQLVMQESGGGFFGAYGLFEVCTHVGDEAGAEADAGVVLLDGLLDVGDADVRSIAGALLAVAAEEVEVLGATRIVDRALDDHPLGDVCCSFATSAEQGALEVVVVGAAALACDTTGLDGVLDALEEGVVDECFVASLDLFTLVRDVPDVVPVAEHVRQLADRYLFGGELRGRPGTQATVVELVRQIGQRVVSCYVQLEGQPDEGRAFLALPAPDRQL
nr:hypothetical protein [Actinacidiphila oryziradicis]